jgi:hypothetical protein
VTDGRLDDHEESFQALREIAISNDGEIEELDDRIDRVEEIVFSELEDLRQRVIELEDDTRMFNPEPEAATSTQSRAALVLKNLANEAETGGIAARDYHGVIAANNGEIRRSRAMQIMREVPDIVGDETVCYVVEEARNEEQNTRVVLDLREGTIPATAGGVRIHEGGTAD